MEELWVGSCRAYFNAYTEAPLFWSVDNGDPRMEVKCIAIELHGNFETTVIPNSKQQPRAWLVCTHARVYRKQNGVVMIVDILTP